MPPQHVMFTGELGIKAKRTENRREEKADETERSCKPGICTGSFRYLLLAVLVSCGKWMLLIKNFLEKFIITIEVGLHC
jgi:hypothetical protein